MGLRTPLVAVVIVLNAAVAAAQSPITEFELSVTTTLDRSVIVQCVRGCSLVVFTFYPAENEFRWHVLPKFQFRCTNDCSSGKVLGGVVRGDPPAGGDVAEPDIDLWVANTTVGTVNGTVVRCVRGCTFAAAVGTPTPTDPQAQRVTEARFPCTALSCASGRISGWVER